MTEPHHAHHIHGHGKGHGRNPEVILRAIEAAKTLPRKPKLGNTVRVCAGLEEPLGLDSRVSWGLTHAPYLALVDIAGGRITGLETVPNPLAEMRGGVGVAIARWVIDNNVDIVVAGKLGRHALEALNAKGVRIAQPLPGETLRQTLQRLRLLDTRQ
ncbi:NifB/NifX family molybdenum-iron cluster-binding protein [Pyrodictium abyssi]|uniref:Dinitrogenase iron-molybdenum cofactor biosynthesis domain-containing protein n=1 Tax=Pyrodictium abyssi TaxID=54256 RepID=A0ABM8ITK0_9CREN|nr:hypothetical protein PABY_04600 [Pyrodictium abyssi]